MSEREIKRVENCQQKAVDMAKPLMPSTASAATTMKSTPGSLRTKVGAAMIGAGKDVVLAQVVREDTFQKCMETTK